MGSTARDFFSPVCYDRDCNSCIGQLLRLCCSGGVMQKGKDANELIDAAVNGEQIWKLANGAKEDSYFVTCNSQI